jgi:hypothetical protein
MALDVLDVRFTLRTSPCGYQRGPGSPGAARRLGAKTLTVTRDGIAREMTVEQALQQRTYQDALAGNGPSKSWC